MLLLGDNCTGQTSSFEVTFHHADSLEVPGIVTLKSFRINAKCAPSSAHLDLESSLWAKRDRFGHYQYESSFFFHLTLSKRKDKTKCQSIPLNLPKELKTSEGEWEARKCRKRGVLTEQSPSVIGLCVSRADQYLTSILIPLKPEIHCNVLL